LKYKKDNVATSKKLIKNLKSWLQHYEILTATWGEIFATWQKHRCNITTIQLRRMKHEETILQHPKSSAAYCNIKSRVKKVKPQVRRLLPAMVVVWSS
jgi:hypothetical protein